MNTNLTRFLDEIIRRLVTSFKPIKIILFGSCARGEDNEESDLDLLVIVSDSALSPVKRAVIALRCLRGLTVRKDILVRTQKEVDKYSKIPSSIEYAIINQGKVVYG